MDKKNLSIGVDQNHKMKLTVKKERLRRDMEYIKYRAWDKKSKKMRKVNSIAFHNEEDCFSHDNSRLPKVINLWGKDIIEGKPIILKREENEVILMLVTGLKDKNKKDIYDADYVRCDGIIYEVYWSDIWLSWFAREIYTANNTFLSKIASNDMEVIGNVYENSDLLSE